MVSVVLYGAVDPNYPWDPPSEVSPLVSGSEIIYPTDSSEIRTLIDLITELLKEERVKVQELEKDNKFLREELEKLHNRYQELLVKTEQTKNLLEDAK